MSDRDEPLLPTLIARLRVLPIERAILAGTDTEAIVAKVAHLAAAAVYLNAASVERFG